MFKLLVASLYALHLFASDFSDYQRSLNAANEEFADFDCEFEDCTKKEPSPKAPKPVVTPKKSAPATMPPSQKTTQSHQRSTAVSTALSGEYSSCLAIKQANPSAKTGYYTLHIEGRAYKSYCQMSIEGGGWTRVWIAQSSNLATQIYDYDLPFSLIEQSSRTFIAYEKNGRELDAYSFKTPNDWKVQHPFAYAHRTLKLDTFDVYTNKRYHNRTLLYGYQSYASKCQDRFRAGKYGKICITDTNAPFFTGFNTTQEDYCNRSLERYNTTFCDNKRFAIFMK